MLQHVVEHLLWEQFKSILELHSGIRIFVSRVPFIFLPVSSLLIVARTRSLPPSLPLSLSISLSLPITLCEGER